MNRETLTSLGLLVMRVGLGIMFMLHGYPKMIGGPSTWERIGSVMGRIGIDFLPTFWGFMAAFAELVGGFMLILGLLHRPACVLLAITMAVATYRHWPEGFKGYAHAMELCIVFIGLLLTGPGKYSVDIKLSIKKGKY